MPTQSQLTGLTELFKRTDSSVDYIKQSEDFYHKDRFLELAEHVNELTLYVKQLQLEVASLAEQLHR